jgi:SpoVK/Ycf46/Vps4 family AAA+-type ATPase
MKELHDLELLLTSHTPIIVIESIEELRLIQLLVKLGLKLELPVYQWAATEGMKRVDIEMNAQKLTAEPLEVLKHIKSLYKPGIFLMLDFHPYLEDPILVRLIKEIAQDFESVPRTLIFVSHALDTPPELKHLTARFDLQLPDLAGIKSLIREEAKRWQTRFQYRRIKADPEAVARLAQNLVGITATDARRLIRRAIEDDGMINNDDLPEVMQAKYQLLNKDGVISFEYDTAELSDVAGLSRLKEWLGHRRKAFEGTAGRLDRPKGIMLLGVQGGGKSLAAKAVAGSFGVPLLRLDFGSLYNKYYGETEKNLRQALATAEVMSPCVLWMDEIEKGIAHSGNDEGVSQRVLGGMLTWMAENEHRVFIVATSNDIQKLPAELVRKGRLDEIFFVDLPSPKVRVDIFKIHLRRRNLAPGGFDLEYLAVCSDGFTGAEIEQAIVSAMYAANAANQPLDTDRIVTELERTSPLSVVMREQILQLRAWAADRTVPAD